MRNIVLTGMSGAGKSTVGVLLAKTLKMGFVDTDVVIQQKTGRRLQDIIDKDGIDAFLETEETVVSGLEVSGSVIATGGSVIYSPLAMAALKKNGVIVYLAVPYPEISRRLRNIKTRGIVMKPGCTLRDVYSEREPLYKKYADVTIRCGKGANLEQSVEETVKELAEKGFIE